LPLGEWYKNAQRRDYHPKTGMELHQALEIEPISELIDNPAWFGHVSHFCGEEDSYVRGLYIDESIASMRTSGGYHPLHSGGHVSPVRTAFNYRNGYFRCGQVNILLALTDIGPGDGPTIVVPGSHKSNFPHPDFKEHSYSGDRGNELPVAAIEAYMKKGDALLFADSIIHGGIGRTNPGERRVVILRYGPSWARTRYGYQYSQALLDRVTPFQRAVLEPVPPCLPGADFVPVEAPVVADRASQREAAPA
jgi:hypothetical protein